MSLPLTSVIEGWRGYRSRKEGAGGQSEGAPAS